MIESHQPESYGARSKRCHEGRRSANGRSLRFPRGKDRSVEVRFAGLISNKPSRWRVSKPQVRDLEAAGCDKVFREQVSSWPSVSSLRPRWTYVREDETFTTISPARKWSSMQCSSAQRPPEAASSKMRRQSAARSTFLSIPRVQDTRRSVDHAARRHARRNRRALSPRTPCRLLR